MHALGCPDVREVAPDFAFGILDGEARADVLLHLDECAACQRHIAELSETADALVLLAPEAEPPPGFERRTLDRIVESSRHRRWRMTKVAAVAAAAAAILSVVTVRIVDESRTPSTNVASPAAAQSVDMIGDGGTKVGTVDVSTTGSAMALDVSVAYGLADGDYHVLLARSGAGKQPVGTMHVTNGYGTWSDTVLATSGPSQLSLQDDQGRTRCSARLPAV
jgi:predicted anti-sigma-YlaC factor YlaD